MIEQKSRSHDVLAPITEARTIQREYELLEEAGVLDVATEIAQAFKSARFGTCIYEEVAVEDRSGFVKTLVKDNPLQNAVVLSRKELTEVEKQRYKDSSVSVAVLYDLPTKKPPYEGKMVPQGKPTDYRSIRFQPLSQDRIKIVHETVRDSVVDDKKTRLVTLSRDEWDGNIPVYADADDYAKAISQIKTESAITELPIMKATVDLLLPPQP